MDETLINKRLYQHFANYEYKLFNTYLFSWESDFFGISKSGYALEVEIKITKSDFRRDFLKAKHRLFEHIHSGKKFMCEKIGTNCEGDLLVRDFIDKTTTLNGRPIDTTKELVEYSYRSLFKKKDAKTYIVNDWDFRRFNVKKKYPTNLYAASSRIRFVDLTKYIVPHSFYFACPAGLIKPEEVPPYAGLIWIDEESFKTVKVIKKAPYLHKNKMDLRNQLLSKFYNLWLYHIDFEKKLEISKNETHGPNT